MKVLVTSAAQDGGLSAARSLARAGFTVIGADIGRVPRGFRSHYMSAYHELAGGNDRELDEAVVRLVEEVRPEVFLPIGTIGVRAAARHYETLAAMTALSVVDEPGFMAAFDKPACLAQCRQLGIDCVAMLELDQAIELLRRSPGEATVVVKPPWDVGSARGVRYVRDPEVLRREIDQCSQKFGGFLIQDYIPGGVDAMRTALLLFSPQSELVAAFTMRKIRQWPQTGGATAVGCSTAEHQLVEQVLPFFRAWRWRGPAEVEFKLDPRDGRCKVIEINPRNPGYLRFPGTCGLDLPLLSVQLSLGQVAPHQPLLAYRINQRYVAPTLFVRTLREDFQTYGPRAALRKAAADLRGCATSLRDLLDDPLPLVARVFFSASNQRMLSSRRTQRASNRPTASTQQVAREPR